MKTEFFSAAEMAIVLFFVASLWGGTVLVLQACGPAVTTVTRGPGDGFALRGGILYRNGAAFTGIVVDTFPGGAVHISEPYGAGRKHGESLEYYPSGKLRWTRAFRHGVKHGLHAGWWENGSRMFAYRFRKGVYRGDAWEWYPDGSPSRHMRYENGVEAGMQRAWRSNGTLYANYEVREGRQYGVINARLCYSVKDGEGVFHAPQ